MAGQFFADITNGTAEGGRSGVQKSLTGEGFSRCGLEIALEAQRVFMRTIFGRGKIRGDGSVLGKVRVSEFPTGGRNSELE
jgi:hypothetical protein